ncbi:hypothetical protein GEV33_004620 [Tenebrio molitor]|uniref:Uncharacterized protein n=1 Tax=Tenebrio molitor TaxID=7067 RepID=A0A8J6HQG4_TENMO|nr:hypothetical protein GEV33_004620 [Tenebrio molitor]
MKAHSSRRTTSSASIELPKFDPSSDDRGASKWCDEIEKLGATFHWLEHEQISRAASSLVGEAKEWFPLWQPTEKSWENFRTEISNMYPPKRNLHEKFRKASLYVSGDASSYNIRTLTDNFSATINKNTNLETDRQLAYDRIQRQATLAKQSFDKKRRSTKIINVGDFVFHPSGNSHLAKLDAKYEGLFEVLQLLPNDRFELKNLATNRKRIVAKDMIRIWPGEFSGVLAE